MSNTRADPYFSCRPGVTAKTPPASATSSPKKITRSSRASSSSSACRTASRKSTSPDALPFVSALAGAAAGRAAAGAASATRKCAITAPSAATRPSSTTISSSTPLSSASYTTVALSVSTSTSGSPRTTRSPGRLSQASTTASSIESDSFGIAISTTRASLMPASLNSGIETDDGNGAASARSCIPLQLGRHLRLDTIQLGRGDTELVAHDPPRDRQRIALPPAIELALRPVLARVAPRMARRTGTCAPPRTPAHRRRAPGPPPRPPPPHRPHVHAVDLRRRSSIAAARGTMPPGVTASNGVYSP